MNTQLHNLQKKYIPIVLNKIVFPLNKPLFLALALTEELTALTYASNRVSW